MVPRITAVLTRLKTDWAAQLVMLKNSAGFGRFLVVNPLPLSGSRAFTQMG
jgi:hypothetical protein